MWKQGALSAVLVAANSIRCRCIWFCCGWWAKGMPTFNVNTNDAPGTSEIISEIISRFARHKLHDINCGLQWARANKPNCTRSLRLHVKPWWPRLPWGMLCLLWLGLMLRCIN